VDFRLWLVMVRAFNKQHLITAIRYMPFLFLYFLLNGAALQANTNSDYMKGRKGYWTALLINIGGLVGWLVIQYGLLFLTGKAPMVTQSLNSIVLIGLTVNLGIATIITKKCLDKTNNIYTGAFLNTILISVVTIASSTMYWSLAA
jgi:peptidoglycan/LPS O-acetylase OafA/YrhL